jgi:hypothetical protein
MATDWNACKFLESSENLKPLLKQRFGRIPSTRAAREIGTCLQQGRLFYEAAESSPLEIRPLQLFYGTVGFAKALVIANGNKSLATLPAAHGIRDVSLPNCRVSELKLKIEGEGTFQHFNDFIAPLTRVHYYENYGNLKTLCLPSAKSDRLNALELTLPEILGRIPGLEDIYRMTFGERANTASFSLNPSRTGVYFELQINDGESFSDRKSLENILKEWRTRFPCLAAWRLDSALRAWGDSQITLVNYKIDPSIEFSETRLTSGDDDSFHTSSQDETEIPFSLEAGLGPPASGFVYGSAQLMSPIDGVYVSEFSLHYLALFLLSTLVRYRPQTWMHAISRSVIEDCLRMGLHWSAGVLAQRDRQWC